MNDTGAEPTPQAAAGQRPGLPLPPILEQGARWAWRFLVVAGALYIFILVFAQLRVVVLAFVVAVMISSLLTPAVSWLHSRGVPRMPATLLVMLTAVTALGLVAFWIVPAVVDEIGSLADQVDEAIDDVKEWAQDGPLDLSQDRVDEIEDNLREQIGNSADGLVSSPARGLSVAAEITTGVLLTAVLSFFFVKDGGRLWAWVLHRISSVRRKKFNAAGRGAVTAVRQWLFGVAITGAVEALLIGGALAILGVPLVVPLASITFFAAFFPIVGAVVAGLLAIVVAWLSNGFETAIIVAIVVLAVQQLESNLLMPVIMGRRVSLHPAVVIVALAVGGALAGLLGAFLAVPVTAAATAAIHRVQRLDPSTVRHVVIVGLTGSGKSTVGALLADELEWPFVDEEQLFAERTGVTARRYAEDHGDRATSSIEAEVLWDALDAPQNSVMSAPASIALDDGSREFLGPHTVVWLRARPATLAARVVEERHQQLDAGRSSAFSVLRRMHRTRRRLYRQLADVVVDVDDREPSAIVDEIKVKLTALDA